MTLKRAAFTVLDRGRLGRAVVSAGRSATLRRQGDPTQVHFDRLSMGWVHRSSTGVLVLPEPSGRGVAQFGELTREVFLRRYIPKRGEVVLDVGAGVGTEALTFAGLVGVEGRVIAIEAHPSTFALLSRTVELSQLHQVETLQAAVMDSDEPVTISDLGAASTHVNHVGASGVSVPAVTIAELMDARDISHVDFLKMNIEGAESAALLGAAARLADIRNMAIGCHDFLADETGDAFYRTREDVRSILTSAGFSVEGRDGDPRPWARDYLYAWK